MMSHRSGVIRRSRGRLAVVAAVVVSAGLVLSGCGRVQSEGGPVREIRPGDVVWIPPGEKHWHGATPTTAMVHLAMQERANGSAATWLEHVTDAQYATPVSTAT